MKMKNELREINARITNAVNKVDLDKVKSRRNPPTRTSAKHPNPISLYILQIAKPPVFKNLYRTFFLLRAHSAMCSNVLQSATMQSLQSTDRSTNLRQLQCGKFRACVVYVSPPF